MAVKDKSLLPISRKTNPNSRIFTEQPADAGCFLFGGFAKAEGLSKPLPKQ